MGGSSSADPRALEVKSIIFRPAAAADITEGDDIEVNLSTGEIFNRTNGNQYQANALPNFVLKIADAGGIVNFLKTHDIQELMMKAEG